MPSGRVPIKTAIFFFMHNPIFTLYGQPGSSPQQAAPDNLKPQVVEELGVCNQITLP